MNRKSYSHFRIWQINGDNQKSLPQILSENSGEFFQYFQNYRNGTRRGLEIYTWIIFGLVFVLTLGGVEIFRRWSLRRNLFDVPNERSSHTEPTARGGGLIIVFICLSVYVLHGLLKSGDVRYGYLTGAILIAAVSWLDDLYSVAFGWRFLIHAIAAILTISTLGFFQEIDVPFVTKIQIGGFGAVLTFLWLVWLTNAYNFMDGIDGIAGTQALTAGIGWLLIGNILNFPSTGFYGGVIAFSTLGFLILNWQPAKIFMGDVGSAFLGFTFGAMPLLARREGELTTESAADFSYLWILGIVLVWLFVFDTVFTFIRRVLKKEKVWEAHRSHLYQRLVIKRFSHQTVTILYGLVSALTVFITIILLSLKKS